MHLLCILSSISSSRLWQCVVHNYVLSYGLEGKAISLSLALKIPVALKLVNPQVFHLQASYNQESHYCGYTSSGPVTKIK